MKTTRGPRHCFPLALLLALVTVLATACGEPVQQPAEPEPEPAALAPDCADFEDGRRAQVTGPDMDAEVERRNAPGELVPAARAYGAEHPEEFGSVWLDHDPDSSWLVVAFTDHLEEHEAALRERLGPDAAFKVQRVEHSLAELEAVRQRIQPEMDALKEEMGGALLFGFGTRDNLSRVALDVVALDEQARRVLAERFGADMICVQGHDGPPRGVAPGGGAEGVRELPTTEIANMQNALGMGYLRADRESGCLWTETPAGGKQSVVWPPGHGVRFTDAGAELVDHRGQVVAREGDWIEMGGGESGRDMERCQVSDGVWVAGSVRVAAPPPEGNGA